MVQCKFSSIKLGQDRDFDYWIRENQICLIRHHMGTSGSSIQSSLQNLGVVFDSAMSLKHHTKELVRNCFFQLRNISKLRTLLSKVELEMIIHAFISSRSDYCDSLFTCLTQKELHRLQAVQNSAARLLTHTSKRAHITLVLAELHWLPVHLRIHFKVLVLTFRALNGQAPAYISEILKLYNPKCSLRSSSQCLLVIPHTHFKTRGDQAFQAVAPRRWNALPLSLHTLNSVESFKKQLKTLLFRQAFS